MDEFKGPDNIYWLFSSSAQAIAAFIGFLAAGFFFSYDRMDKHVEKDETLEDIYVEIKKQYYKRITTLFVLTALSIIMSLATVYLNGLDLGFWNIVIRILVALLNIVTIIWAIVFILFIIDPSKVQKTADKLIKQNENVNEKDSLQTMTRGDFIDKFIELEKLLRYLAEKYQLSVEINSKYRTLPLHEIIRGLHRRGVIDSKQFSELLEVNKVRNLAVHGEIHNVDPKLGEWLDKIISRLKGEHDN